MYQRVSQTTNAQKQQTELGMNRPRTPNRHAIIKIGLGNNCY